MDQSHNHPHEDSDIESMGYATEEFEETKDDLVDKADEAWDKTKDTASHLGKKVKQEYNEVKHNLEEELDEEV